MTDGERKVNTRTPAEASRDWALRWEEETRRIGEYFYRVDLAQARKEGFEEGLREVRTERLAALNYRLSMAQERKEGREEGREEGRTETLRSSIEQVCRMLSIAMTETRRACLHAATPDEAQAIFDHLVGYRTWPD